MNNLIKLVGFSLIASVLLSASCRNVDTPPPPPEIAPDMVMGVVHLTDGGCGIYIDVTSVDGEAMRLYPVNLDEKLKREGVRIQFTYSPSRAKQPEGCNADMAATILEAYPQK